MLAALLLVSCVVAVAEWLWYNLRRKNPGPWGVPVLHSIPLVFLYNNVRRDTLGLYEMLRATYGPTFQFRIPGPGVLLVSAHKEDVEHVLQTKFDNYPKAPWLLPILMPLFGRGIFSVNGHEWLQQRKAASNAFRVNDIKHSLRVCVAIACPRVRANFRRWCCRCFIAWRAT